MRENISEAPRSMPLSFGVIRKPLRFWGILAVVFTVALQSYAATTLVSYHSANGKPSSSDWTGATAASFSSYVTGEIFDDNGRSVLRIYDPGTKRDDNSTPKVAANRTYTYTLTS